MGFRQMDYLPPTIPYAGVADSASTGTPIANQANLIPIWLPRYQSFSAFRFARSGGPTGNIDLGIYRINFERLFSTGSIAYPAAPPAVSVVPFPTGPIGLAPGLWYLAVAINGAQAFFAETTAAIWANGALWMKAGAFPLPATIVAPSKSVAIVPGLAIV
jgi:hypothetical protein